jgi:hypothetical protein
MKNLMNILALATLLNTFPAAIPQKAFGQGDVSFQVFYDDLSPYGQWVDYPGYGYVWVPADRSITPYSNGGHWVYTDVGWTWVSDYPWGWAPFHYGRWYYDPEYNWMWFPSYTWGPAWVSWRSCQGYYGWAPMGPDASFGFSFGAYYVPPERWNFCDERHFADHDAYRYYAPREEHTTIYNRTTVINNSYTDRSRNATYNAGPRREDVEHRTGAAVHPVALRESSSHEQSLRGNELSIYRPQISKASGNIKPAKVTEMKTNKPAENQPSRTQGTTKQAPQYRQPSKAEPQPAKEMQQPSKEGQQPPREVKEPTRTEQPSREVKQPEAAPKQSTPAYNKPSAPSKPAAQPKPVKQPKPQPAPKPKPAPKPVAQPKPQEPPHAEPQREAPREEAKPPR